MSNAPNWLSKVTERQALEHYHGLVTDLEDRFNYHPATTVSRRESHDIVREVMKYAATAVVVMTPPGREQSLAITKLEEAMMWANSAIARQKESE